MINFEKIFPLKMKKKYLIILLFSLLLLGMMGCEEEYYDTKEAGEKFLAGIATKGTFSLEMGDGSMQDQPVTVLASGVMYAPYYTQPNSKPPVPLSSTIVRLNLTGYFADGSVFEGPLSSDFYYSNLLLGLQEALKRMNIGSKWRIWIPYDYAYGSDGIEKDGKYTIDPYSAVYFDVEITK